MRRLFILGVIAILLVNGLVYIVFPPVLWSMVIFGPLMLVGFYDYFQHSHSVLRNWPIAGHARYLLEMIRPEMQQYFIEMDLDGRPFSRDQRSIVYARAKDEMDTVPFGTQRDVYATGFEWVNHSMTPLHITVDDLRTTIGGPDCKQPYSSSLLNIAAMSYGSLSKNAIIALSEGAKMGGFAHNTGEGGISPYHLQGGADLIWQIGTGYFGCRTADGKFCPEKFPDLAKLDNVKMIEIKISQGAKPGHGGILPASKLTPEIAKIRDVPMGKDVISPSGHSAFSNPIELMEFIAQLRELSGGKPVGFKLCVGKRREFFAVCKAMVKTGITPDFITVDGSEGGTGAAPLEFANHIGTPLIDSLILVHNALVGYSLRDKVKVISSGKVITGFGMLKRIALGADLCYSARGMMMAIGCIQARVCNNNKCPVGVATQNPDLYAGLVPSDKNKRVAKFHESTIDSLGELLGSMGIASPDDLKPWHVMRRISPNQIHHYGELYDFLEDGELLQDKLPAAYERACKSASAESFGHVGK